MNREESWPVQLAKESLRYFLQHSQMLPQPASPLPADAAKRAGAFVSLKKHGQLRGCIGTILPTQTDVAREIIRNAVSAATEDPRFEPVEPAELAELEVSVDILGNPERVDSLDKLDPRRYGVIVRHGGRSGVLLPDLEGIDTAADQVAIACRKAGLHPDAGIELYRFEVVRYH